MKFSIEGRMRNMRLPDGRTALLYSVFEAVSNAVHAIEERFGVEASPVEGAVAVVVKKDAEKLVREIVVTDNGVGLNDHHRDSFETCDTTEKESIGGRGVGRLVWFKIFDEVQVSSGYEAGDNYEEVAFTFDPFAADSLVGLRTSTGAKRLGTSISLRANDTGKSSKMGPALLAKSLSHHFFPYFIAGSMPPLSVQFDKRKVDVWEYLRKRLQVEEEEKIDLSPTGIGEVSATHVYVDPSIAKELSNSILLTAQGRVVQSIPIEKKFALRLLENGRAYTCVVRAPFLDEKVDQERTSFKARPEDIEVIKDAVLSATTKFLAPHIKRLFKRQKAQVVDILEEHPQLAVSVEDVDTYVHSLSPGMSDEEIGKSLFTLLYREEKKVRAQIEQLESSEAVEVEAQVAKLMRRVNDSAQRRLAEYTVKRHQIIQLARSLLRYRDAEEKKYALERALHEIICPMGAIMTSKDYSAHNLWLIDDLLSYYSFFASDKALAALGVEKERKEPDLLFFNPFGFRREGTTDPVVIVEFKRPGDEQLTSDPVDQILGYVEKLRNKTVRDPEGEVVSDLDDRTPFECIVICDLTEGVRRKLARSLAQNPTPDNLGYYGFSKEHNASIRVLSYRKVFRDAELRHKAFFDKLGLLPEEVRQALSEDEQPSPFGEEEEEAAKPEKSRAAGAHS